VELHKWDEAFQLVDTRPDLAQDIYLPYAEWLAIQDRFDESQQAFIKAGRPDQASRMLEQLTHNAVTENRFNDAGYYYWLLAYEQLKLVKADAKATSDDPRLTAFHTLQQKVNVAYVS
jgi:intraflagellar transport protein 122